MNDLTFFAVAYPVLTLGLAGVFGLLIGSFLNVVVHRLPLMMQAEWSAEAHEILELDPPPASPVNLATPPSRCPACEHRIRAWENIPVVSYLFLRGRCSACGVSISVRYPVVELLTAALTVWVVYRFGLNWDAAGFALLVWMLVALSLIDYDTQFLPDQITLPGVWLGLIFNHLTGLISTGDALWGAVVGYLSLWSVYAAYKLVTGKEAMGRGDFKLLAMLGAWLGWQAVPLIILVSSLAGAVIGLTLIALGRDAAKPIPFGPYIAIAGLAALFYGDAMIRAYLLWAAPV